MTLEHLTNDQDIIHRDSTEQSGSPNAGRPSTVVDPASLHRVWEGEARRLGEILEQMGVVGATDVLLARYEQDLGDPRKMGEILVAQGLATDEQVEAALDVQRRTSVLARIRSREAARVADSRVRLMRNVQAVTMFTIAVSAVIAITLLSSAIGTVYGVAALSFLSIKVIGSAVYRPILEEAPADLKVAVIAAFYNEDPVAFARCIESIKAQTRKADEIWVIDDGSANEECVQVARDMLAHVPGVVVHRLEQNQGKRHAQGYAFKLTTADVVVTIDSDTVLDESALAEGLRAFSDDKVMAVTGNVRALNYRRNILTRLIDMRYANAFLFERAAYSTVGSVVCCCGSLSFFRAEVVKENLEDFLHQTFMGVEVQYGDDRRLTQYALQMGVVRLQDTAVAYTLVPENLGHYRRQQLRWNKSFFRESLWAIHRFGPRRWPFWVSMAELSVWLMFTVSLLTAMYIRPAATGNLISWQFVAIAAILAYARNVRYFGRPNEPVRSQLATFAMAPLYTVLHVVLLTPLRLYALLTLRKTGWGTRRKVEVRSI